VIEVTRLGGGAMVVNVDLILTIEQTPDTVVALTNGDKLMVLETPEQLVARVVSYRRRTAGVDADSQRTGNGA
jgi:flagellar protein FlbD